MDTAQLARSRQRYQHDFVWFAALFAVVMVLTNIIGTKLFALFPGLLPEGFGAVTDHGPVILTTGIITYPLTFLFTDVVSEVWGKQAANRMVFIGFVSSLLMLAVIQIGVHSIPADRYWGDPSGNVIGQHRVLETAPVGAQRLVLENADALPPAGGRLAVLIDGSWQTLGYSAVESSGGFGKAWHHHELLLQEPLGAPIPSGAALAQVAELRAEGSGDALVLRIDRPAVFPVQGRLALLDDSRFYYAGREEDGRLQVFGLSDDLLAGLADGQPVVNVTAMGPHDMQLAYEATFASPAILLFSSMTAYLVAQLLDVLLFHFWRRVTKGRHLWLRNNGSTAISQLVDTIIVNGIFLPVAFGMGFAATAKVIVAVYICKLALALIDTPLIYLGVYVAKRRLGVAFADEVPEEISRP